MPKRKYNPPARASSLVKYVQLEEILRNFAKGQLSFAVILAKPGLSKSELTKKALHGLPSRIIKGVHSHPNLYCLLYEYKDRPIVFDDIDNLMDQAWFQELLKNITETNKYKKLEYNKKSPILLETETPVYFHTTSPVLLIMNWWDTDNALCQALESRAHFFIFEPDWCECYKTWASWFDDQEIYDYVHAHLEILRQPDARLLVNASSCKKIGMQHVPWKQFIDDHIDDQSGQEVRRLLKDKSFASNNARAAEFVKLGLGDRSTFYRRMKEIQALFAIEIPKPARIILETKAAVEQERPKDGPLADGSVKEDVEDVDIEEEDSEDSCTADDGIGMLSSKPPLLSVLPGKYQFVLSYKNTDWQDDAFDTLEDIVKEVSSMLGNVDGQDVKSVKDLQNRLDAFADEVGVGRDLVVTKRFIPDTKK